MFNFLAAALLVWGTLVRDFRPLEILMLLWSVYLFVVWMAGVFGTPRFQYGAWRYRPFISILVPARNEEAVIEQTVRSLAKLAYHRDGRRNFEVIVIDDGSTDETPAILDRLQQELSVLRVVRRPREAGGGKAAALNEGLRYARGDVIGVFDADSRVKRHFLRYPLMYLADPRVAGVQTGVRMYNARDNLLTRLQDSEFAIFCGYFQKARALLGGFVGLGGNGQFVKREMLQAVGGWTVGSLTEDLDLSIRMLLAGYRIAYCPEAAVRQEAVRTWRALFRQRSRWAQGNLQVALRYYRVIRRAHLPWARKLDTLLYLSGSGQPLLVAASLYAGAATWMWPSAVHTLPSAWLWVPPLVTLAVLRYAWRRGRVQWDKTLHTGGKRTPGRMVTDSPAPPR